MGEKILEQLEKEELKEKDVVLKIAKRLKRKIEKNPRFKVFLTRNGGLFYLPAQQNKEG